MKLLPKSTALPGTVKFYDSDVYDGEIEQTPFDEDVFLEVISGSCNVTSGIDQAVITVVTTPDGDRETVIAIETAPNSGVFRSGALPTSKAPPVLIGNGVLEGTRRSIASATVACDPDASDALTLAPAGAVFVSTTNEPVPGALIELLDESGAVIQTTMTDTEGLFEVLPVGTNGASAKSAGGSQISATSNSVINTIRVTPPTGFTSPSVRTAFSGYGRVIDSSGSYAQPFSIADLSGPVELDIPIDPDVTGALTVEKIADRSRVRLGEIIQYTVRVRNNSQIAIQQSEVRDRLPTGLSFVEGSALLNGQAFADPALVDGRELVFPIGLTQPNSETTLIYAAQVGAIAGEGELTNLAFATGTIVGFGTETQSNLARHTVTVDNSGGVFSRDGVILGKVFMDCDGDGLQDNQDGAEPGIPGVQIHTEEGLSVVTDGKGRFSLPGLAPVTHVLDIYEPTLPGGTHVVTSRVMDAFAGGSRFVPLRAGEIRSEDFVVQGCSAEAMGNVRNRIEGFDQQALGALTPGTGLQLYSSQIGILTDHDKALESAIFAAPELGNTGLTFDSVKTIEVTANLETRLEETAPGLGFMDLEDGDKLVQRSVSIRITGPSDLTLQLSRNGAPVDAARIGKRIANDENQAIEYISIELRPGANTLTLSATDSFGNIRNETAITVTAPGVPARITVHAPTEAPADPTRPVPVLLQVVDAAGHPVASPLEATLLPGEDSFDVRDASEQIPGLQALLVDGRAELHLIPSELVGTRTVRIDSPLGSAEAKIRFVANTEAARIAVGYAEAAYNFETRGLESIPGLLAPDELGIFEDTEEGFEGAFYLKGKVFEDTLLTLRHDSDKDVDDALFRSVDPAEFYPVYGDQSERGFDARSRGKTFASLERGASYLLFGDVSYQASSSAIQLGNFQRTLEGAKGHVEAGRFRMDFYAGETDTGQTVLELPARGISGPYDLGFGEVVENSETIELITRDRNQPDLIIKTERLGRFTAYTLDYFSRTLIFTRPIAARDADLNPVSIRVTFETEDGAGETYSIYGGEGAFDVTDWLSVGARQLTANARSGSADRRTVRAAYVDARVGEAGRLQLEAAQSKNGLDEEGEAFRLSFEQQTETGSYGARLASSTADFDAPGAAINAGREEARLFGNQRLGNGALISGEAIYTGSGDTDAQRYGAVGRYEQAVSDTLRLRVGGRYVTDTTSVGETSDALTIIAGLGWTPEILKGANFDLEGEQEVNDGTASRITLGADYALSPKTRLYTQGEWSSSRTGGFGLLEGRDEVTFRAGAEHRWAGGVTAFTEYRAQESFFDAGVAQGLTASWSVSPAVNFRTRVEHVQPISDKYPRNTSAGLGATWQPEGDRSILDADVEYAVGETGRNSWYTSATYGRRWQDVTLLARNRLATSVGGDDSRTRDRLRIGAAHRPDQNDALNTLIWYEYEYDDQTSFRETRHTMSAGGEEKVDERLRLRGRLAGQSYSYTGNGIDSDEVTLLAQVGMDRDIGERWNAGVNLAGIADGDFENQYYGVGAEVNFIARENAMIGLGYNHTRLDEKRLEGLYRTGAFVRLRIKFDQSVWNIFDGDN